MLTGRVDYGRRAASQPPVVPVVSHRTGRTRFPMYPALRRSRQNSANPLRASFCTLGIGPIGPCSVYTEYSPDIRRPRSPAPLRHVDGFPVLRLLRGLRPAIRPSLVSTDSLFFYRQTRCGSHVPALNPLDG